MASLTVRTLGGVAIEYDGQPVTGLKNRKAQAVLIYLLCNRGKWVTRDFLQSMLWSESDAKRAGASLRQVIALLQKTLPDGVPTLDGRNLAVIRDADVIFDVDELVTDVDSYRGAFLAGFAVKQAAGWDEWLATQREAIDTRFLTRLDQLGREAMAQGRYSAAIGYLQRSLEVDAWREQTHRLLMEALSASGDRAAALAQFEQCRAILRDELGVEPSRETLQLHERLLVDERGSHNNLPPEEQFSPFVGRVAELKEIGRTLHSPDCRLLTLVGLGGIGKTRTALQIARSLENDFADGVWWVELAGVSADSIVVTITESLNIQTAGRGTPEQMLTNSIRNREMLIVLDNFEDVIEQAGLIDELFAQAPGVRLLVTSRERLNLRSEWVIVLSGLEDADLSVNSPAVQLFTHQMQRMDRGFELSAETLPYVQKICRLVGAMPLALELAAAWGRLLPVNEIADEIATGLDILQTTMRDVPMRQRSVEVVFEQTWQRLSSKERQIFRRLSVFRGGFERTAAQQIAGANLFALTSLIDKSLVQRDAGNRFVMHELLRQYAATRLADDRSEHARTEKTHALWFADFCTARLERLQAAVDVSAEIQPEFNNIMAAWNCALAAGSAELLLKMAQPIALFFTRNSRHRERAATFRRAVERLETLPPSPDLLRILAFAKHSLAESEFALGNLAVSEVAAKAARMIYQEHDLRHEDGLASDPACVLSLISWMRGDYAAAIEFAEETVANGREENLLRNQSYGHFLIAGPNHSQGNAEISAEHAQCAYDLAARVGDRWFLAYCCLERGKAAYAMGNFVEADRLFEQGYELRKAFDHPQGIAMALTHLASSKQLQQQFDDAGELYADAYDIYEATFDRMGLSRTSVGLADVAFAQGRIASARRLYRETLENAIHINYKSVVTMCFVGIGRIFLADSRPERGLELITYAAQHPATWHTVRSRAKTILADHPPIDPPVTPVLDLAKTILHTL